MSEETTPTRVFQPAEKPALRTSTVVAIAAGVGVPLQIAATVIMLAIPLAMVAFVSSLGNVLSTSAPEETSTSGAECSEQCIDPSELANFGPSAAALDDVGGIRVSHSYQPAPNAPIGQYADEAQARFQTGQGTPAACWFAVSTAPIAIGSPSDASRNDVAIDLGLYGSSTTITQVARVFQSDTYSQRYPSAVTLSLKKCGHYEVTLPGGQLYAADTTGIEFATARQVRSAGWREINGQVTITIVDLQYGNLVVRTTLTRPPGSAISDQQFAAFILETSKAMVTLVG